MNVLFLCTGNSARSILGEVIFNELFAEYGRGFSAGSRPIGQVNPAAIKILQEHGHEAKNLSSKHVDVFTANDASEINTVISVCDNAANDCPVWAGAGNPKRLHWPLSDPTVIEDEAEKAQAFEETYRALKEKIVEMVPIL